MGAISSSITIEAEMVYRQWKKGKRSAILSNLILEHSAESERFKAQNKKIGSLMRENRQLEAKLTRMIERYEAVIRGESIER